MFLVLPWVPICYCWRLCAACGPSRALRARTLPSSAPMDPGRDRPQPQFAAGNARQVDGAASLAAPCALSLTRMRASRRYSARPASSSPPSSKKNLLMLRLTSGRAGGAAAAAAAGPRGAGAAKPAAAAALEGAPGRCCCAGWPW